MAKNLHAPFTFSGVCLTYSQLPCGSQIPWWMNYVLNYCKQRSDWDVEEAIKRHNVCTHTHLVCDSYIQIGPTKTAPLLISPIEMRVLWTEMKYTKSAARLLNRNWVNKGSLDLSKEVLWVFVGQRTAELPAIKVGGLKKIPPHSPSWIRVAWVGRC